MLIFIRIIFSKLFDINFTFIPACFVTKLKYEIGGGEQTDIIIGVDRLRVFADLLSSMKSEDKVDFIVCLGWQCWFCSSSSRAI